MIKIKICVLLFLAIPAHGSDFIISAPGQVLAKTVAHMSKTHAQQLSEEWITREQVLAILKISSRSLETLKSKGILPYTKIQGIFYFRTADIENLLKENYVNNASINNQKR